MNNPVYLRNSASRWLLLQEYITMHGPLNVTFPIVCFDRVLIVLSRARESSRSLICLVFRTIFFFFTFFSPGGGHGIFHFDLILGHMNPFTWSHYIFVHFHCPPIYSQNSKLISSY